MRNSKVSQNDYYRPGWIEKRLDAQRQQTHYDYYLWQYICLDLWLETFGSDAS